MTDRPATWKVVTAGAAMAGLGILGAGAANAAAPGVESVVPQSALFDAPVDFIALDDDWTDTYWDNGWDNHRWGGDWTDTFWDD